MISRTSRGSLPEWWWTVDRLSFFLILALIVIGLVLAVAASPTADGGSLFGGDFHYAVKQIVFAVLAIGVLVGASLLTPAQVCRVAIAVFVLAIIGCLAVRMFSTEVLGSRRWLDICGMKFQPSEFLKPGFAVMASAILASAVPTSLPKPLITLLLLVPAIIVLLLQPDIGQTFLLFALWSALLFFAGLSPKWFWAIGSGAATLGVLVYSKLSYVQHRIQQFIDPKEGAYQTGLSLRAFAHGGFFGVGPGGGTIKYRLPYAHSDYIFAVAGEEFGFLLCGLIAVLFCLLAVRLMLRSASAHGAFAQLAGAGLSIVVALQAFINMGVAVRMLPAKGMTLPFVSYGGSSLFAVALTMGCALALTRERSQFAVREQNFNIFAGART